MLTNISKEIEKGNLISLFHLNKAFGKKYISLSRSYAYFFLPFLSFSQENQCLLPLTENQKGIGPACFRAELESKGSKSKNKIKNR